MLTLGPLAFVQPWLLLGLLALPAIWLLLRLTPPAPREIAFPPLALLLRLVAPEETPARTPWWLLLLRLAIAGLIIIGLSGPVLNPAPELGGRGPLLLVVDDGWAAAPNWQRRIEVAAELLEQAERDNRPVIVLNTAPDYRGTPLEPRPAREVLEGLPGWQPKAWSVDQDQALARLQASGLEAAQPVWLADGVADRETQNEGTRSFALALGALGELQVFADPPAQRAVLLAPGELGQATQSVRVIRPSTETAWPSEIIATGPDGEVLGRFAVPVPPAAEREAVVELELPLDLRNRIARLELTGEHGVGGVLLFDERWRRRTVGIVGDPAGSSDQPLLAEPYFVERALRPFAEIRRGRITDLVEAPLSLLVVTDRGQLDAAEQEALTTWVERGGVLLRFAGPRLAGVDPEGGGTIELGTAAADPLLPVRLRSGDRQLGGALSWSEPLPLAPFQPDSPFAGLEISEEAIVFRQVLAEPSPELAAATLASLADGTPIVTGRSIGEGQTILVHTTANTSWTSLPLSGVFVDILRRIAEMGIGAGSRLGGLVRADRVLAADGSLVEPPADLQPLDAALLAEEPVGPTSPAGLYTTTEQRVAADAAENERGRVARNLQDSVETVAALDLEAFAQGVAPYSRGDERNLMPLLLTLATLLALADLVVSFLMRGLVPRLPTALGIGQGGKAAAVLLAGLLATPTLAQETADEAQIVELTMDTRLAYVRTGLGDVDERSRQGLVGLSRVLEQRSSIETAEPVAVDPALDDLALFPLLYWPIPPEHPGLAEMTLENLEVYLRHGGMVLFDTGDGGRLLPGQDIRGPGERRLGELLRGLDLAPLEPIADDHVLTRSFYLMQDLPGRFAGRPIWVDRQPQSVNDGVSSVVIGAHDWAGAWAEDDYGRTLYPVVPGGERQREMARRFGVNLVMYALTGNYKTDQVHIPALLERLGQ